MDTYTDDSAKLPNSLGVRNAVLVGHSTGGDEVAGYVGRHGSGRVVKAVLIGGVPPVMLKSDAKSKWSTTSLWRRRPVKLQCCSLPLFEE
jgi:pimeloyl-ACP methyl ester carboxylesterase